MAHQSAPVSTTQKLAGWRHRLEFSMKEARKQRGGNFVQLATVDPDMNPRVRTVVFRGFEKLPAVNLLSGVDSSSSHNISSNSGPNVEEAMKIVTDRRSEKVGHLLQNPKAELLWWFPSTNEQYRIFGECKLADANDAVYGKFVADNWKNLSDATREQFFWAEPGKDFAGAPYSKARKYDFLKDRDLQHQQTSAPPGGGLEAGELVHRVEEQPPVGAKMNIPVYSSTPAPRPEDEQLPPPSPSVVVPKGGRDAETGKVLPPPDAFMLLCLFPKEVKYLRLGDNFATMERFEAAQDSWSLKRVNP
ncbi:unnamed protein product [Amoebophrya sp. A120]|nr:unnamed protein product [Amoebophrya sp. A120]|eukprot:GSA120T00014921001.1